MKIAYLIKKKQLYSDSAVTGLLERLSESGMQVYDILQGQVGGLRERNHGQHPLCQLSHTHPLPHHRLRYRHRLQIPSCYPESTPVRRP